MLEIVLPAREFFNEETQEFLNYDELTLEMEHSLVSLAKWEEEHEKPFLVKPEERTTEEMLDYVRCMVTNVKLSKSDLFRFTSSDLNKIGDYINASHTATWFSGRDSQRPSREVITAEVIYYWMVSMQIPKEFENWHLNRLFTLIRVFSEKNKDPKHNKMNRKDAVAQQRSLNAMRKAQYGTRG